MPRQGRGEVGAAHNTCDALKGIIHHHSQVVGPEAIGPFHQKVVLSGGGMVEEAPGMTLLGPNRRGRWAAAARVERLAVFRVGQPF